MDNADSDQSGLVPEYRVPILASSPEAPDGPAGGRDWSDAARPVKPPGWTPLLVFASTVTVLGAALPCGFNIGVINTPAAIIKAFCNESVAAHYDVHLTDGQLDLLWSGVVSVFVVGGMAGAMSGGWAADRLGRKRALAVSMVLSLAASALLLACRYANSVEMLLLARVVVGLSAGLTTSVMPLYLLELAPVYMSGALGSVITLGINSGVFFSQLFGLDWLLGSEESWHFLLALFGPPALLSLAVLPALTETPKYLSTCSWCAVGRTSPRGSCAAYAHIRAYGGCPKAGWATKCGRCAWSSRARLTPRAWPTARVLRSSDLLLPLVLVVVLQAGQQLSDINQHLHGSAQHVIVGPLRLHYTAVIPCFDVRAEKGYLDIWPQEEAFPR